MSVNAGRISSRAASSRERLLDRVQGRAQRARGLLAMAIVVLVASLAIGASFATSDDESRAIELPASDHPRKAIVDAAALERRAVQSGDKALQLRALRLSVMANLQVEENEKVKDTLARGLALARELDHPEALRELLTAEATLYARQGRFDEASRIVDEAVEYAAKNHLVEGRAKSLVTKAEVLTDTSRLSEALRLLDEAYAVFEHARDAFWMSDVLSARAHVHGIDRQDPAGAEKAARLHAQANSMIDPKAHRYACAIDFVNLGNEYSHLAQFANARDYLGRAIALGRELDDPVIVAFARYRLGIVEKDEGHDARALAYLDEALPVFEANGITEMVFGAHLWKAQALSHVGRPETSLAALALARKAADQLATPNVDVGYAQVAIGVYESQGDVARALEQSRRLRDAEKRQAAAANSQVARELALRFDVRQKETENELLRTRAREADARRIALVLALVLGGVALSGALFTIYRQFKSRRRLIALAMRDELTGLPNRHSILEFARLQFNLHTRAKLELCIAILDLDNFKAVNDSHGHATGDAVLVAFAEACRSALRGTDLFGRYGGEEFLLVMPGAEAAEIPALFERLRKAVRAARVPRLPEESRISFSLGAAQAEPDGETLDGLIARADSALYQAKEDGRDRCTVA